MKFVELLVKFFVFFNRQRRGEDLDDLSIDHLRDLEQHMTESLNDVRGRKVRCFQLNPLHKYHAVFVAFLIPRI